jgi:hypothetical protein
LFLAIDFFPERDSTGLTPVNNDVFANRLIRLVQNNEITRTARRVASLEKILLDRENFFCNAVFAQRLPGRSMHGGHRNLLATESFPPRRKRMADRAGILDSQLAGQTGSSPRRFMGQFKNLLCKSPIFACWNIKTN